MQNSTTSYYFQFTTQLLSCVILFPRYLYGLFDNCIHFFVSISWSQLIGSHIFRQCLFPTKFNKSQDLYYMFEVLYWSPQKHTSINKLMVQSFQHIQVLIRIINKLMVYIVILKYSSYDKHLIKKKKKAILRALQINGIVCLPMRFWVQILHS